MPVPPSTTSDSGISGRNTNQPAPSSTGDSGYNSRNSNQPSDGTPSFNSDTPSNSMKNTNNTNNTNNAGQEPKEIKIDAGGNVVTTTTTTTTTTTSTTGGRNNDQKSEPNSNKTSHLEPGPPQRARSRNADSVPQDISSSDVNSPPQDSPPIPTRSTRRQSPQPSSREPMTPLPQYGTNFSRPNARSPNPTMAATHNEAQRVGTVEGLKQAAAEIHVSSPDPFHWTLEPCEWLLILAIRVPVKSFVQLSTQQPIAMFPWIEKTKGPNDSLNTVKSQTPVVRKLKIGVWNMGRNLNMSP